MDPEDTAEEAEFRAIKWKPNDKGLPGRRMPADYIMRKDPNARRAYLEMHTNLGLSHEEAELRIERAFDAGFREILLHKAEEDEICSTVKPRASWIHISGRRSMSLSLSSKNSG
jgi:hypothetical protein